MPNHYLDLTGLRVYHAKVVEALNARPTTVDLTTDETLVVAKSNKADKDGNGNNIVATYATKNQLPINVSDLNNDAGYVTSSGTVANATNDSDGNNIAATYAKKSDISGGSGGSAISIFTYLNTFSLNNGNYYDFSTYLNAYKELMIIAYVETDNTTKVGVSSGTSGSTFLCSLNVTEYSSIKFNLIKTSNNGFVWTATCKETGESSYHYSVNSIIKYFRNESDVASSVVVSCTIFGRN